MAFLGLGAIAGRAASGQCLFRALKLGSCSTGHRGPPSAAPPVPASLVPMGPPPRTHLPGRSFRKGAERCHPLPRISNRVQLSPAQGGDSDVPRGAQAGCTQRPEARWTALSAEVPLCARQTLHGAPWPLLGLCIRRPWQRVQFSASPGPRGMSPSLGGSPTAHACGWVSARARRALSWAVLTPGQECGQATLRAP